MLAGAPLAGDSLTPQGPWAHSAAQDTRQLAGFSMHESGTRLSVPRAGPQMYLLLRPAASFECEGETHRLPTTLQERRAHSQTSLKTLKMRPWRPQDSSFLGHLLRVDTGGLAASEGCVGTP